MARPETEISDEQLKQLEQLLDSFPWFSYGQLLLLKGLMQRRHPSFDARLRSASLYATSRERLHDYLKQIKVADPRERNIIAAPSASLAHSGSSNSGNSGNNSGSDSGVGIGSDNDDAFEVMPFDTVCEKVVDIQPALSPPASRRQSSAAYHDRLIDMFLTTPPATMKPRSDVSGSDLAQPSEKNTTHELVSETLAEIYLAQGLPDKAAQIYSKLSLLYPEKKAYFAARLQSQCAGVSS